MEPKFGTFHDVETGETITRELTIEEIAALAEPQMEVSNVLAD
jgi:hypothetical protein